MFILGFSLKCHISYTEELGPKIICVFENFIIPTEVYICLEKCLRAEKKKTILHK